MNPSVILALISDLYQQLSIAQAELKEEKEKNADKPGEDHVDE